MGLAPYGLVEVASIVRQPLLALLAKQPAHGYELTAAGHDAVAAWVEEPSDGPRIRDEFFAKLILAPRAGLADQMELINKQRHHYYRLMRGLNDLQDSASRQDSAARLLVEGTRLHLQADLDWLERCQEELV